MAKRRKKRFRMQPRFFLVLVVLVAVALLPVLLVRKIQGIGKEDAKTEETPLPTATAAPTATPKPSLPPNVTVVREENVNPSKLGFSTEIKNGGSTVSQFTRKDAVSFGRDGEYSEIPGILTFGGNNYRNTFTYGTPIISDKRLHEQWSVNIGAMGNWSGTGWTGMPLIVHWPDETLQHMNVSDEFKKQEGGLTEVVYPAMDGNIYFLELETSKKTRNPIVAGVVQKGTACIDPRGYPLLYVGQGIPMANDKGNNAAYVRVYNLLTQEEMTSFGGYDYLGHRKWQAYDGSAMIANDTIVYGGENGILYTRKLNASYDAANGKLSIKPDDFVKLKYTASGYSKDDAKGQRWYGIESSVAAFRNYAFYTDNGGRLQCVDLNTMQLKYVVDVTDETDASVVIEENYEDNTIYLYTGSQVKIPNGDAGDQYGYSYQRKINGLTGAIIWEKKYLCGIGDSSNSGGCVATPHVGKNGSSIGNLVIYSLSLSTITNGATSASEANATMAPTEETSSQGQEAAGAAPAETMGKTYELGGRIVAYDKSTGEIMWSVEQTDDYWSSPVVVYDEYGRAYLIQCDRGGTVTLYDASKGTKLNSIDLGSRIDSTPSVYGNYMIVGTRGKGGNGKAAKIVCVKIS
ncbi:MAG: PQQ-binding-like beta-propeller repeat protein [Clostridia bacterium]